MNSRKSPIPLLGRKASQDDSRLIELSFKVTVGTVPNFLDVRQHVYPIVRPWGWIKKARDSLQSTEPKCLLIAKQISSATLGVVYGYCINGNEDNIRYISSVDLDAWQVKERDLPKYAHENLIKKVGLIEKTSPLFIETQTGIYYSNQLKNLTSSLLAIPDVFKMVSFKISHSYSHVVVCPTNDLIFVTHSHDPRGLCLIAEICIRLAKREPQSLLQVKPIRVLKGNLTNYEASIVRNEASWPTSEEQIKTYKKTVIKRTRKQSARLSES